MSIDLDDSGRSVQTIGAAKLEAELAAFSLNNDRKGIFY